MTITKQIQEDLKRYSFVEKVKWTGPHILIYYNNGKIKKIPYRSDTKRLIKVVDEIKAEIGFEEKKKLRDIQVRKEIKKPMMFVNT